MIVVDGVSGDVRDEPGWRTGGRFCPAPLTKGAYIVQGQSTTNALPPSPAARGHRGLRWLLEDWRIRATFEVPRRGWSRASNSSRTGKREFEGVLRVRGLSGPLASTGTGGSRPTRTSAFWLLDKVHASRRCRAEHRGPGVSRFQLRSERGADRGRHRGIYTRGARSEEAPTAPCRHLVQDDADDDAVTETYSARSGTPSASSVPRSASRRAKRSVMRTSGTTSIARACASEQA